MLVALLIGFVGYAQHVITAQGPDGKVVAKVTLSNRIYYEAVSHNEVLLTQSVIEMQLRNSNKESCANPVLKKKSVRNVSEEIKPLFPLKYDQYALLALDIKCGYGVDFRIYNDGVAFRMRTTFSEGIDVMRENTTFQLADDCKLVMQ